MVKNSLPSPSVALSTTVPVPSGVKGLAVVSSAVSVGASSAGSLLWA